MTSGGALRDRVQRAWRSSARPLVELRDRIMFAEGGSSRWPVRSPRPAGIRPPFFIVGSPRSGTTLLRAILTRHPDLFIPPENGAIGRMIRVFGAHRRSEWNVTVQKVLDAFSTGYEFAHWAIDLDDVAGQASMLPNDTRSLTGLFDVLYRAWGAAHAPGKSRWADKTVSGSGAYLDKLALVFPESRYVHLVRDGRDCVASALRAGMFRRDARAAAYGWKDSVNACRRLGRRLGPFQYLELRYEDLVKAPGPEVNHVCEFLDLDPTDEMLTYDGRDDVADVNAIAHHTNVRRPIFTRSIGTWKQQLRDGDVFDVVRICGAELKRYGYA